MGGTYPRYRSTSGPLEASPTGTTTGFDGVVPARSVVVHTAPIYLCIIIRNKYIVNV